MVKRNIIIAAIVLVAVAGSAIVIQRNQSVKTESKKQITIGAIGSDAQIWQHIAKLPETKKANITIKVKNFTDGVALNTATSEGKIDVNAFQSYAYYVAYNKSNAKTKLTVLGTTYLEPMGIYSDKYQKISDIPDGGTIAIANNAANTARGLKLLAKAKLITLKPSFGNLSGVNDIQDNPHHLKFKEIDDTTGPRVIKDNTVAAALIGNTVALEGKLNVLKDALLYEKIDQSTKDNINILATAQKNKNNKNFKKLTTLYHTKSAQKYINQQFSGTKIEVKKPITYLSE
ncbi:MetQ/NlpA family ABC transporter substrate-binding protein [Leuconostoc rapi]|uniref:MetQ/NlpA family ABC transporter substrate-binding protein n=1 Tax=Leuconostoc rapi TaxID=1406906 RepID=UPI00195831EC|nr:MetQ/NlpA family ABC transporter substrate-binding protein [Leuconostoc rapi]MBM7435061.1 D-methionine transport system substrate-binding protein [Leuconostoc rapi]